MINIPILVDRLCYRYPSMLVDAITEHEPGRRLVAVKNVTVNEEFFQGHFPGAPTLPGVLMLESLSQVAAILLLQREDALSRVRFARYQQHPQPITHAIHDNDRAIIVEGQLLRPRLDLDFDYIGPAMVDGDG